MEIRWLLRAPVTTRFYLRWQDAVEASQSSYPIKKLEAELQPDQSCVKLRLLSDGWEEGMKIRKARPGATAVFLLSWVLCHVRYALATSSHVCGRSKQMPWSGPPARRSLSSQSGALITLLRSGGPALLLCTTNGRWKSSMPSQSWFAAVELEDERAMNGGR